MSIEEGQAWFGKQYKIAVNLDSIVCKPHFKRFFDSFPVPSDNGGYELSSRWRMNTFGKLKVHYPFDGEGYVTALLSVSFAYEDQIVSNNYGYVYWNRTTKVFEYMCIGHTFESKDGEYRSRFQNINQFLQIYNENVEFFSHIEKKVLEMIANDLIQIDINVYPEDDVSIIDLVTDQINNNRLPISIMVFLLNLDAPHLSSLMLHTEKTYIKFMRFMVENMPDLQSHKTKKINEYLTGQKLVPMTVREVMQPYDYNFSAWRETLMNQIVSNLVINYISLSFSIYNQYMYIEGSNRELYTNESMQKIYERGAIAELSLNSLREARKAIIGTEESQAIESYKVSIYNSIEYAQSYLLISNISMLHTMEHVGVTIDSYPSFQTQNNDQNLPVFDNIEHAKKIMFDLTYAAHCLHTKVNIVHGDLHSNNMTIRRDARVKFLQDYKDPVQIFVTGPDESDVFIFERSNTTGYLIDFSRGIFGPDFRPNLENEHTSPHFIDSLYRNQINRIMKQLHKWSPEYVASNQEYIKAAIISRFDLIFPVLCCVDFISIGVNLGHSLARDNAELGNYMNPEIFKLLRSIEDAGRSELIIGLQDIVEFIKSNNSIIVSPRFPGNTVINKCFPDNKLLRWEVKNPSRLKTAQLVDAVNYNNPVKYDIRTYADYPPWAQFENITKNILPGITEKELYDRELGSFLQSIKRPAKYINVIAEKERVDQVRLDGEIIVSANSSWLD
jgi:hypothetical protein